MKKLSNKQSGFTLIEIIVVLIIVGVLAAIALPNLFSNVNRSRGGEALASLGAIKTQIEGCIQAAGSFGTLPANCLFAVSASPNFAFSITSTPNLANINALGQGALAGSVSLNRASGSGGAWTCSGSGIFGGIC
jgi:prepilin-type N-terminal cleavage/methylation domain-containing protein